MESERRMILIRMLPMSCLRDGKGLNMTLLNRLELGKRVGEILSEE